MKKLIHEITIFLVIGLVIGELSARIFYFTSDIPTRTITSNHIQKFKPNQKGYWKGKTHSWQINELGWPGPLPNSFDNLITVIGDSFIENLMNPDSCHQGVFLKEELPEYNFLEISRSGVSFIEALELTKELDSLTPKYQLIYVSDSDFDESISQIKKMPDITQLNLETNKIVYGELKAPFFKKVLYNWKFIFYLYRRFQPSIKLKDTNDSILSQNDLKYSKIHSYYRALFDYIDLNYQTNNVILVLKPDTSSFFKELITQHRFNYVYLDNKNDLSWSFEFDDHWTCYGHQKASKQVSNYIKGYKLNED